MRGRPGRKAALRLILAYAAVSAAALAWGPLYVEGCLPLYRAVFSALAPQYRLDALDTLPSGEAVIAAAVTTRELFAVGGGLVPAGLAMTASTLAGHALQPPTLLFAIGLAWRLRGAAARALQLVLLGAMLVVIEAVDVPLVLLASVYDLLYANFAVPGVRPSWLVSWMDALNGGGRLVLSVAAAVAASLAAAHLITPAPPRPQPATGTPAAR